MDNTLYDWVEFFVPAFYAMVDVAVELLAVGREQLLDDLQAVHRSRGSAEHPFALLETATVTSKMPRLTTRQRHDKLEPAFDAFNRVRAEHLHLYPGVRSTLTQVRSTGCPVVAYTESASVNVASRLRLLDLAELVDAAYAPRFVGGPHPVRDASSSSPVDMIRLLPADARKPDPEVALAISADWGVPPAKVLFVGDNLTKDIAMAHSAGMHSAWAKYGTRHSSGYWDQLVRVSHWPSSSVTSHGTASPDRPATRPSVTLEEFAQLLQYFRFQSFDIASTRGSNALQEGETDSRGSK